MRYDLLAINTLFQKEYDANVRIDHIFKKITQYRLNSSLGHSEYASSSEVQGLNDFEILQVRRDLITIEVYQKYQSDDFVQIMRIYNADRKALRLRLAQTAITWREFVDQLGILIEINKQSIKELQQTKPASPKELASVPKL